MIVLIYKRPNCALCETATHTLKTNNIPCKSILMDTGEDIANFKTKYPNVTSVPYFEIVENDKVVTHFTYKNLNSKIDKYFRTEHKSVK